VVVIRRGLFILLLVLLGGCAVLPGNTDRPVSSAFTDTGNTFLGRAWREEAARHAGESAFYLLGNGLDAFVARAVLAQVAERSIDLQYYMIHPDHVGVLLLEQLLAAADRGVRVRILLDDIDEGNRDFRIAVFDRHPNIQVRIFNPFGRNVARIWQYVTGFGRQTRRAHNKSYTVDNTATILGGRNIGDEYFERDPKLAFQDLDVLALGPVASEVSSSFDRYWNHELSYPIATLLRDAPPTLDDYRRMRDEAKRKQIEMGASDYLEQLRNSELAHKLRSGSIDFEWAQGQVFADPPDKLLRKTSDVESHMIRALLPHLESAQEELIVLSPYFVPGKKGMVFFQKLRDKGVKVRILTNSLASTDVSIVHAGYARYRRALLRMGVELWELNEVTSREERKQMSEGYVGKSKSSLHAKAFVVDRKTVFIGSLNLDPRSVIQNTEIGVLFRSAVLGGQIARVFDDNIEQEAFRLELVTDEESGQQRILWHGRENGRKVIYQSEPHVGLLRRLGIFLMSWLPIESQI
jgi:putative cardiolipin synthase